jgi:hypothetical protein
MWSWVRARVFCEKNMPGYEQAGLGLMGWNELARPSNVILPPSEGRRENLDDVVGAT